MRLIAALLLCLLPLSALAQDPLTGPNKFPQFRNLSGLAGGGYGLDEKGYRSLSGPTAFSTPVAHVLGHDLIWIGAGQASFDARPRIGRGGYNGTGVITYGHTFGQFNLAFTDFYRSSDLDQSYNLQLSYVPRYSTHLVASLGVQDVYGNGGSAGTAYIEDRRSSRSIFGVITYRIDTKRSPIYISAGIGEHRFARPFASASYQFARPARIWVEDDGYGINAGVLLTQPFHAVGKPFEINVSLGYIRGEYFAGSIGLGF